MKKESNPSPPVEKHRPPPPPPPPPRITNAFGCPIVRSIQQPQMTKRKAIRWFKEITGGAGVDRYECLDVIQRGRVAEKLWDDPAFTLGVEYGVLIALVKVFDITREDLT